MTTQRILYDTEGQAGKLLAQAVNATVVAVERMRRVGKLLDAATYGDDWAALGAELGIDPAKAQQLWTIVSTARTAIDVPQVAELARLDQG